MLRECTEHGYFRGYQCPVCKNKGKFLMNTQELESLGRMMAGVLRHFPEKFNLEMDEMGWIDLMQFITALKHRRPEYHWLRQHHILAIVKSDPKGRYQLEEDKIRATYGHSLDIELDLPTDKIPGKLYYPATEEEVELLLETGLKPSDRKMVHLSKTYKDAEIAGKHRVENPIILEIDAKKAIKKGAIIKRAGTTVFVTRDIEPDFILKLEEQPDDRNSK
jgi:putative RNA 2'-phosphotransferase